MEYVIHGRDNSCIEKNKEGIKMYGKDENIRTYSMSGTYDTLVKTIASEFQMPEEQAEILVLILARPENKEKQTVNELQEGLWQLWRSNEEYFRGPMGQRTNLYISFTNVARDLVYVIPTNLVKNICIEGKLNYIEWIIDTLAIFIKNMKRVDKKYCCIYFNAIEFVQNSGNTYFSYKNVMPYIDSYKLCCKRDQPYACKNEMCDMTEDECQNILKNLEQEGILHSTDEKLYQFIK